MAEDKFLYKRTQDLTEKSKKQQKKTSPGKNQHLSWAEFWRKERGCKLKEGVGWLWEEHSRQDS